MADRDARAELLIATMLPAMLAGIAVLARRKHRAARELAATLTAAESAAAARVAARVARARAGLAEQLEAEVTARVVRLTAMSDEARAAVARRDAAAAGRALGAAGRECDEALAALRAYLRALPAASPALAPTPQAALDAVLARAGTVRAGGDPALTPPGMLLAAARVLADLLPSRAPGATVRLDHRPQGLRITVHGRDAGPAALRDPVRLAGLRERVQAHDGRLDVDDAPWRWRVRAELPSRGASLPADLWGRQRTDAMLALFGAAIVVLDVVVLRPPRPLISGALGITTTALPLALRRRRPLAVCAAAGAGLVAGGSLGVVPRRAAALFEITVVPFAAAGHAPTRSRSVAGVAVLTAGALAGEALQEAPPRELGLLTAYGAAAGALAWFARHHQGRALALAVGLDDLRRTHPQALGSVLAEERDRIARDLHDLVGHGVTLARVAAGAAEVQVRQGRWPEAAASVATLREAVAETAGELERLVRALHAGRRPAHEAGLDAMLRAVEQARRAGQPVTCAIDPSAASHPLPAAVAEHVHRTVQEALTNARRHAGGGATTIDVHAEEDRLVVRAVTAQGAGATAGPGSGRGLAGLRRAAVQLGGELTAGPRDGGRTFGVETRVPLAAAADA